MTVLWVEEMALDKSVVVLRVTVSRATSRV
jgi:hypothetical protein